MAFLATLGLTLKNAPAAPVRIMPLGDSITAGYTDNDVWNVPFTFGYRGGLYTRLTNAGYNFQFVGESLEPWNGLSGLPQTVAGPDLRDVNQDYHRGYGGQTIDYLSSNIVDWLNADNPDVVLLMAGINNIAQGSSGEPLAAETAITGLIQTIMITKPEAHLIVALITPYSTYTDSIVRYNSYIQDTLVPYYAGLGENISLVDQYANFVDSQGQIIPGMHSNGINHPSQDGYDLMAETWFQGIGQVVDVPEPSTMGLLVGLICALAAWACRRIRR